LAFLALQFSRFVLRANELSVNEDMVALVKRVGDGLAKAVAGISYVESVFFRPAFAVE